MNFYAIFSYRIILFLVEVVAGLPRPPPRTFLSTNFDLDLQISDTLRQLSIRTRDEHTRSHQDDDPTQQKVRLSWKVQINSRCDVIATDHLRRQTKPVLLVPFLPASRVSLAAHNRTITSKLPTQLRHIGGSSLPIHQPKVPGPTSVSYPQLESSATPPDRLGDLPLDYQPKVELSQSTFQNTMGQSYSALAPPTIPFQTLTFGGLPLRLRMPRRNRIPPPAMSTS
jgi:hypothetical protein